MNGKNESERIGDTERYEHCDEATEEECAAYAADRALAVDADWQAFRRLCRAPDGKSRPGPERVAEGVRHLRTAARHGHRLAQYRLAEELSWGDGSLGLALDAAEAVAWYAAAADNGHPAAVMHLAMLYAVRPDVPREHAGAKEYLDAFLRRVAASACV